VFLYVYVIVSLPHHERVPCFVESEEIGAARGREQGRRKDVEARMRGGKYHHLVI